MANPFDKFGYAEQGPEDEPTSAKSVDDNPFDQFGYEEEPAAPPMPPEPESMWDKTKRLGTALGSGAGEEASKMRTTLALAASAPAVLYGKIQELWGDPKYAHLGDVAFKQFVDPAVQSQVASQLPPNATTAEKVLHGVGATATMIGEVVATGGGAAPEMLAQQTAEEGVTAATSRLVGEQVKHGAQSMQVPAVSSAIDAGRQSLEKTGDKATAIKVAQATYLQNVLAGTVPLAKQGGLVTRALSGAASGAASAEAGRQVQNAVVPDSEQTPFSLEDTAIAGVQGGMMGAALGPRGTPSALGGEHAANSPVDAIEAAHEQAMQQTAADGGDKLDQVLAGAKAATEHAAVHDEAFVAEITRQNAEQEAVARLQEQIAAQVDMSTPEGMFANREVEQQLGEQQAREEDFPKAQFQAEMQKGESIQQQAHEEDSGLQTAPFENDVDTQQPLQTLGDYMPKTLGERRAAEGVQEKPAFTEVEQPEKMNVEEKVKEIDEAAHEAATSPKNDLAEPTEAQIEAGNYKKGHVEVHGEDVTIENPKGSTRSGKTPEGREWSQEMQDHYGYIRRTEGADGDHVDTFVGDRPDSDKVYVVDQIDQRTGAFDEHKAMMGYPNQLAAVRAYKRNFGKDWKVGPVKEMSVPEFKEWAHKGDTKRALQPEKIHESTPASQVDVEHMAGAESKRGEQSIRFALGEDPDTQYERLGTSATSKRTFDETKSYYDTAHESASRIAGRTIPETKLAARRAAMQAPEKGIAIVKTGDSEWTVYNDREPGQVYTSERSAYDDVFGADADARAEQDAKAPSGWESADSGLPSMTKEAAEEAVRNTFKNAPELNIHVHKDFASMPEGPVRERLEANKTSAKNLSEDISNRVRGLYDPTADEVHIFANNHPDAESVIRTVLHEVVAHKGLKAILKDRMASTMQDVHDNLGIRDRRAMEDIAERYGIDLKEKSGQRLAAEEYVAKLAERSIESPILARVIAAVRAGLRRMGLVKGWSNEDIRALLRSSRKNLDEKSRAEAQADQRIRYALGEPDPIVEKDPKNPLSQLAKFGATMESQAKYSPGLLQKVRDSLANFGESKGRSAIQGFLGTIPRSKLPDFVGKGADGKSKLPAAQKYVDAAHNMDNFRNRQLVADETIAKKWSKLQKRSAADAGNMGELMHAATLAGVDPAKEFEYSNPGVPQTKEMRAQDALRRQQYDALRPFWNRLSPDAKRLYEEVRDKYVEKRRMVQTFLEDRINDTDAPLDSKRVLLDTLRKHFESGSVKGPYFPLARFGEYWGSAKNNKGEVVAASRFESPQEQKTWREQFTKQGYVTDGGRNMDAKTTVGSINPEFVAKVTDLLGGKSDLADSVWQLYMQSLPEMSMRKAYIHRLGRLGFSGDALRAYGTNMFHMSHQIARLKYMHKMDGHLQQLEKQARTLESSQDPEAKWARPLVSEMNARHRWAMNPTSNPIVSALTSLGFAWHLVASPAAGVVNLTQTPMVAMPVLSAEFGFARTNRALLKAATEVAGAKLMSLGKQSVADRLKGDEQKAMLDAEANGSFGRTQAHMLAGATNEEGFDITSKRHQAMEIASWVFHNSEVFNRKVTFLAAFRLAKQKGMSYDDAFYTADKLNMDSHFDVSNANRARVMQSGVAKVLTLFKNYSLNMTYRLARDFREAVRTQTTDPAARTAAQKRFAGMMVMTATMAGTSGLPLAWLTHAVINTVFSDPDTDFDSEDAFRAHLTAAYGSKAATAITRGPFEAATGLSISDRVGLNNLWIQSPPENTEGEDLNRFYLEQAAGPALSPFLSVAPAAKLAGQGYYERSLERVLPKAGTDLVKTLRYARDGATDMHGNTLMPADEFSAKQLFFQSIGFVPEELATLNAQSRAVKGAEQKLHKRKELLIDKYFLASHNADKEGTDEALKDIMTFDKKNPTIAIGAANIVSSAKSRAKFNALAVEGTTVDPKLGYLHNRYKFTPKKETSKNDSED